MRFLRMCGGLLCAYGAFGATTYTAVLTGSQGGNNVTGMGRATVTLNDAQTALTINVTYSGLSGPATAAHIHRGAAGTAGPVVFPFGSIASPISDSWNLTAADASDFLAGNLYVNIHTAQYPGGEIRGQLLPSVRVNCGGTVYTDTQGRTWSADTGFSGGTTYTYAVSSPIQGTADAYLYQSERWSPSSFQYQFSVPNGDYTVNLKFAEIYQVWAKQRIFSVSINGSPVLTNFDVLQTAGASLTALDQHIPVTVTNGVVLIQFSQLISSPKVSAIEIVPQDIFVDVTPKVALDIPSGVVQFTAKVTGTANTQVNWTADQGSVSSTGGYTSGVGAPGYARVTATSAADVSRSDQATVSVHRSWYPNFSFYNFQAASSAFYIPGVGGDVFGTSDAFLAFWSPEAVTGDVSFTARVNTTYSPLFSKAGIMLRQSTDSRSAHVFLSLYSGIVALLESRAALGQTTAYQFGAAGVYWLRLERTGNTCQAYVSDDGVTWIGAGSAPLTAPSVYAMLAYAGGTSIIFDNVTVSTPVGVSLSDRLVSLAAGQSVNFSATVTGTANQAVTWSISPPGQGSITSAGVYTAPATIASPATVTVTATSVADGAKSASTVVQLGFFTPIRVNAGGPSHIDPLGVAWSADTGYDQGSTYSAATPPTGTLTPYLYQSEHFNRGPFQYKFNVPNGTYTVTLKFAEIYYTQAGQRIFNVAINGAPVLTSFDIVTAAGGANKALDRSFPVTVTNGTVTILFAPVSAGMVPKVNAIEITQGGGAGPGKK